MFTDPNLIVGYGKTVSVSKHFNGLWLQVGESYAVLDKKDALALSEYIKKIISGKVWNL